MKKVAIFAIVAFVAGSTFAQTKTKAPNKTKEGVGIEKYVPEVNVDYLRNGLKVITAIDHSQPKIYGAVIVHAGSKNEDPEATGVAHYFEHIMFKGTDKIGTTDWEHEKKYLDSISDLYDTLHAYTDAERKHEIQKEINRLNIEASKFAIANETDAILQQMGCTGLNAYTNYDVTCYHNTLPSNQLENWMEVYAERFRNPVYRLFQGELEAVYEERNIYANEPIYTFSRNMFTESFGEHPYSRDIIGLDEHLKSPQPSAMKKFYDKYYVASNMTLLLVGDFDRKEAITLAERYFGIWPKGEKIVEPQYNLPRFDSLKIKEVKQTPVKVGLMVFPGVKTRNHDGVLLDIMSGILAGENGLLAQLTSEGKLMAAEFMPFSLTDAGTNVILYVPRLIGQKHVAAEELIWAAIDSVKAGAFSDKLLESLKKQEIVERKQQFEDYQSIASLLENLETSNMSLGDWIAESNTISHISKYDIMRVASKYFDRNHCTIVRSNIGFGDKETAIKPDWEHLEGQNQGKQTDFAKKIEKRVVRDIKPQVIDIEKDVQIIDVSKRCRMYSTKNQRNDIFSLTMAYHYGLLDDKMISTAVNYFNSIGGAGMSPEEYRIEMGCYGAQVMMYTTDDYTFINITGEEKNIKQIIELFKKKLQSPKHDAQQIKNIVDGLKAEKKMSKDASDQWASALSEYVIYGQTSSYINHATIKDTKKAKGEDLIRIIERVFMRDGYVTFVGNTDANVVAEILRKTELVREDVDYIQPRTRIPVKNENNVVYYTNNKKFLKSDIMLNMPSIDFDYEKDRAACALFNEYMGGGMNSVFFQEIREFRSLGYSTYGFFSYERLNLKPANYYAYLGTQCDKTTEGIAAMRELMIEFPDRKDKFNAARDYLVSVMNSHYIPFRLIPAQVRYWQEIEKKNYDPRIELTTEIAKLKYSDIKNFHKKYIEGRPMIILINGNAKKYDVKELNKYGTVKELKYKNIFKF